MSGTVHKGVDQGDGNYISMIANGNVSMGRMVAVDVANSSLAAISGTAALKAVEVGIAVSTRMTGSGIGNSSFNYAANAETFSVKTRGVAYATANGSITVGDSLEGANSGALANGTTNPIAWAMESANDGETVKIWLMGRTW